jgi:hypothetical protein
MKKFNIRLVKNSHPTKYFEDCVEHYSYDKDSMVYTRVLNDRYGIWIFKDKIK